MKKFLLSLAAVALASGAASADEYVLTPTGLSDGQFTYTSVPESAPAFTLTAEKAAASSNPPAFITNSHDARVYADGTLTIAAPEGFTITEIKFELSAQGKKRQSELTVVVGTMTQSAGVAEWKGEAPSVAFTVGNKATFGTDGSSKAGQLCFSSVTIVTAASALVSPELAFQKSEIVVDLSETMPANPLSNPYNLPLSWTSSDEEVATVNAEGAVTLVGEGSTVIKVESEATDKYFAGTASYTLVVTRSAKSIADMFEFAPKKGDVVYVGFPMTVMYANGKNIYVEDENGTATLIYMNNSLKKGDVIPAGWTATNAEYNGLPEWTGNFPTPTENVEVVYSTLGEVSEDTINCVGWLRGVEIAKATSAERETFNVSFNGASVQFYNSFSLASVAAGTYNVLGVVSVHSNVYQFLPIEYDVVSAVETVKAEAAAEYFTIDGLKVENPVKGLYIKVAGGKASKIVL